ncbi:hypothetical protein KDI_26040 [Dictyobacter arantiisoli]|uniref:Uncharacterized protein n=1 Tax=Dictyobacter arantiisoli TaxID=2014874 RepID=A0A5A5TC11_9CHLR|nr:hypothetical protein KDI_26040 [Dictyobacter arantiisoli]
MGAQAVSKRIALHKQKKLLNKEHFIAKDERNLFNSLWYNIGPAICMLYTFCITHSV